MSKAVFTFIGFDKIVTLSLEAFDPPRSIPRALLLALAICSVLYVLVAITAVSVLGAGAIAGSATPLTLVMEHDSGSRGGDIIAAIAIASTTNTTLLMLTAASRLVFRISSDSTLPPVLRLLARARDRPGLPD